MTLEMKRIRYSSRYGYSLEWHEPASVRVSYQEALFLDSVLKAELPYEETEKHFTSDEQAVIQRYLEIYQQKLIDTYVESDESKMPLAKLKANLQKQVACVMELLGNGPSAYIQEYLGWPILNG